MKEVLLVNKITRGLEMENKIVKKDKMLCLNCMKVHEVDTVEFLTTTEYKGTRLQYNAISYHCPISDDYWQDEDMITENWNRMLEEYKEVENL